MGDAAPDRANRTADRRVYERYLPIVRRISMKMIRKLPPQITIDDLLSAGWLGLVEALGRCSPNMPETEIEAYVSHRIRGAILDYLRSLDPMSRKMRNASRQLTTVMKTLTSRFGRAPEEEEIAAELGVALESYQTLLAELASADLARLETVHFATDLGDDQALPDAIASRKEIADRIAEAIEELPERLRLVVGLYYQEDCNLREIGAVLGVTESRACQLHSEAIHRIRATLEITSEERPRASARGVRR
jgi:RNA polymerase sigma factor for flagellar operon FliA